MTHNAAGSPSSISLSGVGIDATPPAAPAGLVATAGTGQVILTWTASGESDLAYYVLYRSQTTSALGDSVGRVDKPGTTFTNTGLSGGTYYYRLKAVDSAGNRSGESNQVSVTLNQPPTATAQTVITNEDVAQQITLSGSDPDGHPLTFTIVTQPTKGSVTLSGAVATYTPTANANGADSLTFTASDGPLISAPATVSITITPVNDPPSLADIPNPTIAEDTGPQSVALTFGPGGGSDEASQTVTVIATSSSPALIPNPTVSGTTLTYTPVANANGSAIITLRAKDSGGTANGGIDSLLKSFTVTVTPVNDPPTLADIANPTLTEDAGPQSLPLTVGPGGGADEAGQTVIVTATSSNPALIPHPGVDGNRLRYTPVADSSGAVTIQVKAKDSGGTANGGIDSLLKSFTVTVTPVNDPPVLVRNSSLAIREKDTATLTHNQLQVTDVDHRAAQLTYTLIPPPTRGDLKKDEIKLSANSSFSQEDIDTGRLTYTHTGSDTTPDRFTFRVSDGAGGEISSTVFSITITPRDRPIANPATATAQEDSTLQIVLTGSDSENKPLTFTLTGLPGNGTATLSGAAVTYRPQANFHGADRFTFTVSNGLFTSDSAAVSITVLPVNDPPVLTPIGNRQIEEGTVGQFTLTATDVDGDSVSFSATDLPRGATLVGKVFSWIPDYAQAGTYNLVFTADDGHGGTDSKTATVTVTEAIPQALLPYPPLWNWRDVPANTAIEKTLYLKNPGSATATIDSLRTRTPAFAVITPIPPALIKAGDSLAVVLQFTPAQEVTAIQRDTLVVFSTSGLVRVPLSGRSLWARIAVEPDTLDFGEVLVGEKSERFLEIHNEGNDTLRISHIQVVNRVFSIPVSQVTVAPGGIYALSVGFTPADTVAQEGKLLFTTHAGSHQTLLKGKGVSSNVAVRLAPAEFGRVWLGQEKTLRVWVENLGASPARIEEVELLPDTVSGVEIGASQAPLSLAAGDSLKVATLLFKPEKEGVLRGVSLHLRGPGIERTVPLRGSGIKPPLLTVYHQGQKLQPLDTVAVASAPVGESSLVRLEVRNEGGDTLRVDSVHVAPEEFRVTPAQFILAPGRSAEVEVVFRPVIEGAMDARLILTGNDPAGPYRLTVRGTTPEHPPLLSFSPVDTLRFGVVAVGESGLQPVLLRNRGGGSLKVVLTAESPQFVPVNPDTVVVGAGQEKQVSIRFTPLAAGVQRTTLLVHSNDPVIELAVLPLSGTGGALYFVPLSVNFGEVPIGSRVDTTVQVVNQTAASARLELAIIGAGFEVDPAVLDIRPNDMRPIQVGFRPRFDDRFTARLEARDRDLQVELVGRGALPPLIRILPATGRDFGEVEFGQVGRGSFTVLNDGEGILRLFDLSLDRREYQIPRAGQRPLAIPPGESLALEVLFTPLDLEKGTVREVDGRLLLVSNDPRTPEVVRTLEGKGVPGLPDQFPAIAVTPEELDFGVLDVGEEGRQSLQIRNAGEATLAISRIEASERQIRVEPESLLVAPDSSRQVMVRLRPEATEAPEGIIRLLSNDPEKPLVKRRYVYQRPVAQLTVLTELLRFGPEQGGQRIALLALLNQGQAHGIVELVDESGHLAFDQERLVIDPGQVGRTQVVYQGSGGSGQLALLTNDPAQHVLTLPWQAETVLQVERAVPEDGAVVDTLITLSLVFTQPLKQTGGLAGLLGQSGGLLSLQARLLPEPRNPWRRELRAQGRQVDIPLKLDKDRTYRLIVVSAESAEGVQLSEPFETTFSTAPVAAGGRIAGQVRFADGQGFNGTLFLADAERQLVGSTPIAADGSYELERIPAGVYRLFVQEAGTGLSFADDREVRVNAGEALLGVDLDIPVQQSLREVVGKEPLAQAVEAPAQVDLQADSTFVVPVYTDPVEELTGFAVRVSFDPEEVVLIEAVSEGPDTPNALRAAGGFPLFLTRVVDAGTVEFGGSLLGATAATAPDEGGILAYFTFKTQAKGGTVQVEQVRRRTLRGEDWVEGLTVRFGEEGKPVCLGDFDDSGEVDFSDFFLFADAFGQRVPPADPGFDLHEDGEIDFSDFFVFADRFRQACGVAKRAVVPTSLSPASLQAKWFPDGDSPTLELRLETGYPTRGLGVILRFDPARLQYQQIESGPGLALAAETEPGQLVVGHSWEGTETEPTRIVFKGLGGEPVIELVEAEVRETDGQVRRLAVPEVAQIPGRFGLAPNYPNPFNPETILRYQLPERGLVRLEIYNLLGQRIRTLVNQMQEAGYHQVVWDSRDEQGQEVASGVYLCRLQEGAFTAVHRLVLIQ